MATTSGRAWAGDASEYYRDVVFSDELPTECPPPLPVPPAPPEPDPDPVPTPRFTG